MRISLLLVFSLISFESFAQCDMGELQLQSQSDVDDFVMTYESCPFLTGNLTIQSTSNENPIQNLTGLSFIESIEGTLTIKKIHFYDSQDILIPGSLEGLNNLQQVTELILGDGDSDEPEYHIQTLEPLANIGSEISKLEFRRLILHEPFPDFTGITSLDFFVMIGCIGIEESPKFPNLLSLKDMFLRAGVSESDSLHTVNIPDIPVIGHFEIAIPSTGVRISDFPNLKRIVGGAGLTEIKDVIITGNDKLDSIPAFNQVVTVQKLNLNSCRPKLFEGFKKLASVHSIDLDFNTYNQCDFASDILNIRIGEDIDGPLSVNTTLDLTAHNVDTVHFTAQLQKLGNLSLDIKDSRYLTGFSALDTIVQSVGLSGYMSLRIGPMEQLPDFGNLKHIERRLMIYFDSTSTFSDFNTFLNLSSPLYWLYIHGGLNNTVTTLNGFQNIPQIAELSIYSLQSLEDISSLFSAMVTEDINLGGLPELTQDISFANSSEIDDLRLEAMSFTDLSQFSSFTSISTLELSQNDFLISTTGLNLQDLEYLFIEDNPLLEEIDFPLGLELNGIEMIENPSLMNCHESEVICALLSTVNLFLSEVELNGTGCNGIEEILEACFLSAGMEDGSLFKIWSSPDSDLFIEMSDPAEVNLNLFNIQGQLLFTSPQLSVTGTSRVELPELAPGVYVVEVSGSGYRAVEKVFLN